MKVMKFGGTSVGSAQRMKDVAQLITKDGQPKIVVLSAMSGTTNTLVEISDYLYKKNPEGANNVINQLEMKYLQHIKELYSTEEYRQKTEHFLREEFNYLRSFTKIIFTSFEEKIILAQGEIISTNMVTNYLKESGVKTILLSALDFMRTDKNAEPDINYIKEKLHEQLAANPGYEIYLTQGFICRNAYGEVDNLLRGGSDYTACLIGASIQSEEIQSDILEIDDLFAFLAGYLMSHVMYPTGQICRRTRTFAEHHGSVSPRYNHQQRNPAR